MSLSGGTMRTQGFTTLVEATSCRWSGNQCWTSPAAAPRTAVPNQVHPAPRRVLPMEPPHPRRRAAVSMGVVEPGSRRPTKRLRPAPCTICYATFSVCAWREAADPHIRKALSLSRRQVIEVVPFLRIFAAPLAVAAVTLVACYWRPALTAVLIPVNALLAYGLWRHLHEPSIFDSIQGDLGGRATEAHVFIAIVLVAAPAIGLVIKRSRRGRVPRA
jgi:hypothetical protein